MQGLYRIEYIKQGKKGYQEYGYVNDLEEAKHIGQQLLASNKANRVKITIVPVNGAQITP